jgi:hypothetical protein
MRYVSLLLALLTFMPFTAVHAQDEKPAPAADTKLPPVNWVEVESTGTLGSVREGALERTIWKGQKRSVVEPLVYRLPNQQAMRSTLSLQRRLLLSKTDFGQITNDIGPLRGSDFLIQRINKLMDMGLYDDAWELYTQKAEDPYDASIAQLGMLLMMMRSDLATACLEEKVFSGRYPGNEFFKTLDKACAPTLGGSVPTFENKILQAIYNDSGYSVAATNYQAIMSMNDLERALVLANGKIRYDGLTSEIVSKTPSSLIALYLMDKKLPDSAKTMLKAETDARGLSWYLISVARDEDYQKAKSMKAISERWPIVESVLSSTRRVEDLKHYADMVSEAEPKDLSPDILTKSLQVLLLSGRALPDHWVNAAQKAAPQKPILYIYLQLFQSLTPTKNLKLAPADVEKAFKNLKPQHSDQLIGIIETLDSKAEILNNLLKVYDKHSYLTVESNYVMPSTGLSVLLETASDQKQSGITVLAALNALAANPDNMYSGAVRKALYSILNVGLLEDAKLIGSEVAVSVLNKY